MLAFIFFLKPFVRVINKLVPGYDEILPLWPECLDPADLSDSQKALDDVQEELGRELAIVQKMFKISVDLIDNPREGKERDVSYIEPVVNNLRAQIVRFLWQISAIQISVKLSKKIFAFTAITDDIESIGNHVMLITDLVVQKNKIKIKFSKSGDQEIKEIVDLVNKNIDEAMRIIATPDDQKIRGIISREDVIDTKIKESRERHVERFHKRLCRAEAGPFFVEMLIHLERISDLCNNIAEYVWDIKEKIFE